MADTAFEKFREFNFEQDSGWQSYRINLEIPQHVNQAAVLGKYKAKWFKANIDLELDVAAASALFASSAAATANGAQQQSTAAAHSTHSASTPQQPPQQQQPQQQQQQQQPRGTASQSKPAASTSNARGRDAESILMVMHSAIMVLALLYMVPILGMRWSFRCYQYCLRMAAVAHGYKVYLKYGMPQLQPWNRALANLQAWAPRALPSTDFHFMVMSLVMMWQRSSYMLFIVPVVVLAAYHAAAYAAAHQRAVPYWQPYGARLHALMLRHQVDALRLNALCEIMLGFWVVGQLLTPARNFMLPIMYWQQLRQRYHAADSATYHHQVWQQLNQLTQPYVARVQFVQTAIGLVRRWFEGGAQR